MMLSQWEASTKKIPAINASGKAKEKPAVRDLLTAGVVAEEGFEPSQTESESVVLPLHNSAVVKQRILLYRTDRICQEGFPRKNKFLYSAAAFLQGTARGTIVPRAVKTERKVISSGCSRKTPPSS